MLILGQLEALGDPPSPLSRRQEQPHRTGYAINPNTFWLGTHHSLPWLSHQLCDCALT